MTIIQSNSQQGPIPKAIIDFIKANRAATICCIDEDSSPYCFSCIYSFQEDARLILFKSSEKSHHSKLLSKNNKISGTILPDILNLLSLKGIQFSGKILYDILPRQTRHVIGYYTDHPFAITKPGRVWCIQLETIKMTDSTHTFGKKIFWNISDGVG